jgi:hypothetical protein
MFLAHFTFNFSFMLIGPKGLGLGADIPLLAWLAGFTLVAAVVLWVLQGKYYPSTGQIASISG